MVRTVLPSQGRHGLFGDGLIFMAQDMLHSRPESGKTFTVALWVLGVAAVLQMLAVGWAVLTRPAGTARPVAQAPLVAQATVVSPPHTLPPMPVLPELPSPGLPETRPDQYAPPPVRTEAFPPLPERGGSEFSTPTGEEPASPIPTGPVTSRPGLLGDSLLPGPRYTGPETAPPLSTLLSQAALQAPAALGIPDPEVAGMVDAGAERRASGNMQGALDALRQAEAVLPEHPRVLAEIAATYEEMGLDPKASLYWERVRDLGPQAAGAWHAIALGELSGHRAGAARAPAILKLGKITPLHDPAVRSGQGERVVLSVTVQADPNARPSPSEMSMLVYFYDLVDGEKKEASTADTSQNFVSAPYDWLTGGTETIDVIYHQPVFSEEQKRELGERAYYGYIIELYYREELQDSAAFPPDLKSLDPKTLPSPLSEQPLGPENSLFPSVPNE